MDETDYSVFLQDFKEMGLPLMNLTVDKNSISSLLYISLLKISQTDSVAKNEKLDVSILSFNCYQTASYKQKSLCYKQLYYQHHVSFVMFSSYHSG